MLDIGNGIAIAGLSVSAGAVVITAIRTYGVKLIGKNGKGCYPCAEHSGVMACLDSFRKTQDRQEKWLEVIAVDIKSLLRKA